MIYKVGGYKLETYKIPMSGRWRWKFLYNNRTLARSDYNYGSESAAKRAFSNFISGAYKEWFYGEIS